MASSGRLAARYKGQAAETPGYLLADPPGDSFRQDDLSLAGDGPLRPGPLLGYLEAGVIALSALTWWLMVVCTSAATPWSGLERQEEFCQFTSKLHDRSLADHGFAWFSLRFADSAQERGYIASHAASICKHVRPLCVGLALLGLFSGIVANTKAGITVNPSWLNWSCSTAVLYNCSGATYLALCVLMYAQAGRPNFRTSRYLEYYVMSWLSILLLLLCVFFNRWFVSQLHLESADKIFISHADDESYVFVLFALATYLCIHTRLRFIVVLPFCSALPICYAGLCWWLGTPLGAMRAELHRYRGFEEYQESHLTIAENFFRLAFLMAVTLWGKHIMERNQRTAYMHKYESFQMIQELDHDSKVDQSNDNEGTAIGKARAALNKALQSLEALVSSPVVAGVGLTTNIKLIRGHIEIAQSTLKSVNRLFEVSAADALKGKSYEGNSDLVRFITDNMGGVAGQQLRRRASRLSTSGTRRHSRQEAASVHQSVEVAEASSLARDFGVEWAFNALGLARQSLDRSCLFAGERALVEAEHGEALGTTHECIRAWVRAIHGRYLPNHYHNEAHATNVSHMCMWFARQTGWLDVASHLDACALLIAAIAHDVGHIGRNNLFCTGAGHSIALIWNDEAVLESMHSAVCFSVMRGEADLCECLDVASRAHLRKSVVAFIMATDIKRHHVTLETLKAALEDDLFLRRLDEDDDEHAYSKHLHDLSLSGQAIINTADVGHGLLPWTMHREWAYRVNLEFFEQGDEEQRLGLAVSPLCSRRNCNIASGQAFFIDCICSDMFTALSRLAAPGSPGRAAMEACLRQGAENKQMWREEAQHFDPLTLNRQTISERFARQRRGEILYPYRFEKQDVVYQPVPTAELLLELARFMNSRFEQQAKGG